MRKRHRINHFSPPRRADNCSLDAVYLHCRQLSTVSQQCVSTLTLQSNTKHITVSTRLCGEYIQLKYGVNMKLNRSQHANTWHGEYS